MSVLNFQYNLIYVVIIIASVKTRIDNDSKSVRGSAGLRVSIGIDMQNQIQH
jgi:hypothetical protein